MEKLMRLAVVVKNPIIYHAPLYREYAAAGNDIEVLYLDDMGVGELTDSEFKITIRWDVPLLGGYRHRFLKNYSPKRYGGFLARVNPGLLSSISKKRYEAVLITGYDTLSCWLALFVAKLKGVPVIWRGEATLRLHEETPSWKKWLKKIILLRFFRACDAVMYSCTGNKEYLEHYGVSESKLFPIPCAVDNDYFQSELKKYQGLKAEIKSDLEIDVDDYVVLFVSRITNNKRPMDLVRAIEEIAADNITVVFVGDGLEKGNVEQYCLENQIKAVFVGFINQSNISKYYVIGDLYVLISGYDNSPKAMNEAMNFGLPLICTRRAGTANDLVKHGVNGYLVDTGDIADISSHISYLNSNRELSKAMGSQSLATVKRWSFGEDAVGLISAVQYVLRSDRGKEAV